MTRDEHQPQHVVADIFFDRGFERGLRGGVVKLPVARDFGVFAIEPLAAAKRVDRTVLGRCHQPSTAVARDARCRPLFERGDQRILCEIFGQTDVAHDAREARDEFCRFDPPNGFDRGTGVARQRLRHLILRLFRVLSG
jgi:hypothetical protein